MKIKNLGFLLLILAAGCKTENTNTLREMGTSKFVWIDASGDSRQEYLIYRYDLELKDEPVVSGDINLWAHSRYKLYVNGEYVNFGPVRSYNQHAEYDSYDLSPYLRAGHNFISVQVLQNGVVNYQVPSGPGAFIAWGTVKNGRKRINLETPGKWKVCRQGGFDPTSPKMTFATAVMESYNEGLDCDWNTPDAINCNWISPVVMEKQDHYKIVLPRTIPPLTNDEISPDDILQLAALKNDANWYSFRIQLPDRTREDWGKNKRAYAETYIYSPEDQVVEAGLWWGEYFLNGKELKSYSESTHRTNQRTYKLSLKEGWNHFFVSYGIVWASWEFYMSVPKYAGLVLSPSKELTDPDFIKTTGPFPDEKEKQACELSLPFEENTESILGEKWTYHPVNKRAGNPAFEIVWSEPDMKTASAGKFPVNLFAGNDYSIILDIGGKTLGRFFIEYEGDSGVVLDLGYAEDMKNGRPWVLKRAGLYTAVRFVTGKQEGRLESFKPYGARFLELNVRNISDKITIRRIGMMSQVFPYEKKGSFSCSDTMMNKIWELGWRTLRVCSEDSYTDTPFRERGLYAGDALPEFAISLAVADESRLMERSLRVFRDMYRDLMQPGSEKIENSVNHMSDFPLITLLSYAWLSRYTGDMEFTEEFYPGYSNMMKNVLSQKREDGSFEHGNAFIEWTRIDKRADLATIQSMIIYALDEMAGIASLLGYTEDSQLFSSEKEAAIPVFLNKYWDKDKGAFTDGYRDGKQIDHHYPISSAWPVMFGQTDSKMEEEIKKHMVETLTDIGDQDRNRLSTPYGGFYILEALYRLDMEEFAEFYIRKYWSPMILKHNDTAWENFGDGSEGQGQGTLSHAWSGHPTYYLPSKALGVNFLFPLTNNNDSLVLQPQSSLEWAKGTVPYKNGLISIDWKIEGNKLYYDYHDELGREIKVSPKGNLKNLELVLNSRNLFK